MHRNTPTNQEILVLRAVASHGTIRAAADALCLSPHTVDTHLDHLRAKSGLRYLPQLVAWGAENGWLGTDATRLTGCVNNNLTAHRRSR